MSESSARPEVVAIVGPTAAGKSAIADRLALALEGQIISADSMQVYRGMDIGTAKTPAARRSVPYHCIDLVSPGEPYSAALFQRDARAVIDDLMSSGTAAILVGGTGLYVRAALDEMDFPAGALQTEARERIEADLERLGPEGLHEMLRARDPAAAALIHPNNTRRTVRALEMLETEGISYADQVAAFGNRREHHPATYIGICLERAELYRRIEERVDEMIEEGLLDEVQRLLTAGYRDALTAAQAIGYKEFVPVIESGADLGEAVSAVKQATRRYAKRQLTWFRADPRVRWLDVTELSCDQSVDACLALIESESPERP